MSDVPMPDHTLKTMIQDKDQSQDKAKENSSEKLCFPYVATKSAPPETESSKIREPEPEKPSGESQIKNFLKQMNDNITSEKEDIRTIKEDFKEQKEMLRSTNMVLVSDYLPIHTLLEPNNK